MGKPVVAARIGQVQELIAEGETGMLFEPGNTKELMTAIQKLIQDARLRRALGEKARDWVRQARTWEQNAQQVIRLAEELVAKRGSFSEEKMRA
jgi:glycosyltransferase involved in cell wall biosynthesis